MLHWLHPVPQINKRLVQLSRKFVVQKCPWIVIRRWSSWPGCARTRTTTGPRPRHSTMGRSLFKAWYVTWNYQPLAYFRGCYRPLCQFCCESKRWDEIAHSFHSQHFNKLSPSAVKLMRYYFWRPSSSLPLPWGGEMELSFYDSTLEVFLGVGGLSLLERFMRTTCNNHISDTRESLGM